MTQTIAAALAQNAVSTATKAIDPELKKAAEKFEAVFMRQVIGEMRKAKLGDELFGSSATDNFREMADAQTADAMSKQGVFGIGALLSKQLNKAVVK
ncbi:Flagellar protein FlgJ N-terminal domain-containing protein [Sphingomonas antarctica]|uniref:rod-binding protein n=1 Tax=Sphingomonas antarctica TaxID=2040274 RepID=UPI0039ED2DAD